MTDPIAEAARFLSDHVEWARHTPLAEDFLADVDAAARLITGIIDGAPPMVYLGPCGLEFEVDPDTDIYDTCSGDIYARQYADTGRCRTCGAEVDVEARRQWLDETVRGTLFRAVHIAEAYGINVNTIRSWYDRGRLAAHGDEDGKPTFLVGEVLDLAADAARRRAENEAKKARKAA